MGYIFGIVILLIFLFIVYTGIRQRLQKKNTGCNSGGCSGCSSANGCPVMEQYNKKTHQDSEQ